MRKHGKFGGVKHGLENQIASVVLNWPIIHMRDVIGSIKTTIYGGICSDK